VPAWAFYRKYVGTSSLEAREKLLEELAGVIDENVVRIGRKQRRLQVTTIAMIIGLLVAGLLIAFDRPTKMEPCSEKSPNCHHRVPLGSKKSAPAARSPKTSGELIRLAVEIERGQNGPLVEVAESIEG
jgi:hypothetical protein